jgi:hypothetical protein
MDKKQREDFDTAQHIREAQAMQRAFGHETARTFLAQRKVDPAIARRVLDHPEQRRQFWPTRRP